jgi:hypothetical protein
MEKEKMNMKRAQPLRILALLVLLLCWQTASAAPVYDAVADFSATQNPNSVWSYGSNNGLTFTLFTPSSGAWVGHDIPANTAQQFNTTSASISLAGNRLRLLPTASGLPSSLSQDATVRWTAPSAGDYSIIAHLEALAAGPGATSPVVTIYHNNTSLDTAALSNGFPLDFNQTLTFNAGDTLDFKNPPNLPQSELNVLLSASIQPSTGQSIPLPAALYAFFPSAGLAAYFHQKWRRRRI